MDGLNLPNDEKMDEKPQIMEKPEKTGKPKKQDDEKLFKRPFWIQTSLITLVFLTLVFMNYNAVMVGVISFWMGLTGLNMGTLFLIFFGGTLVGAAYFVMVTYWTAGITNVLIYAKLLKKKVMLYADSNDILRFKTPKTNEKTWLYEGYGEFKLNEEGGKYWLPNGLITRLFLYGYGESVNLADIRHRNILMIDPLVFEDRNREVRLEAVEGERKLLNPQFLMYIIPLVLVIGVAAYLIMGTMQTGACQNQLSQLAMQCGKAVQAQAQNVTSTTLSSTQKSTALIPFMK